MCVKGSKGNGIIGREEKRRGEEKKRVYLPFNDLFPYALHNYIDKNNTNPFHLLCHYHIQLSYHIQSNNFPRRVMTDAYEIKQIIMKKQIFYV